MGLIDKLKVPVLGLALAISACGDEPANTVDGEYKVTVTERRYGMNDDLVMDETDYTVVDVLTLGSEKRVRVDFIAPHDYDRNESSGDIEDSWVQPFFMWSLNWESSGTIKDGDLDITMSFDAYDVTNGEYSGHSDYILEGKKRYE